MVAAGETSAVFLLAQNRLLRDALAKILDKKRDICVVGSSAFSPTVLDTVTAAGPDVLLMDSFSAGMSHLEFMREVRSCVPGIKVIMIGMDEDEQAFLQAIREGAVGYVLKDASALEVVSAVRSVANGEAVCPPAMIGVLFACVTHQADHVPSFRIRAGLGLTSREQQLVLLIGRGFTNKEIAMQLQLAEQTVRNHVHRVLRKLGADNRFAAVEMCRTQGLSV